MMNLPSAGRRQAGDIVYRRTKATSSSTGSAALADFAGGPFFFRCFEAGLGAELFGSSDLTSSSGKLGALFRSDRRRAPSGSGSPALWDFRFGILWF